MNKLQKTDQGFQDTKALRHNELCEPVKNTADDCLSCVPSDFNISIVLTKQEVRHNIGQPFAHSTFCVYLVHLGHIGN